MRIDEIVADYEAVKKALVSAFAPLSKQQLNWRPSHHVWSVGQCIEHLILSKQYFMPVLDEVIRGRRTNTWWENWSPLRGVGTRMYFRYIQSDKIRVRAPTRRIVPPSDIDGGVVERFATQQEEMIEKLREIHQSIVDATTLTSPFLGIVTYKLSDGLRILAEHDRRHIRQALRVTALDGFPTD